MLVERAASTEIEHDSSRPCYERHRLENLDGRLTARLSTVAVHHECSRDESADGATTLRVVRPPSDPSAAPTRNADSTCVAPGGHGSRGGQLAREARRRDSAIGGTPAVA